MKSFSGLVDIITTLFFGILLSICAFLLIVFGGGMILAVIKAIFNEDIGKDWSQKVIAIISAIIGFGLSFLMVFEVFDGVNVKTTEKSVLTTRSTQIFKGSIIWIIIYLLFSIFNGELILGIYDIIIVSLITFLILYIIHRNKIDNFNNKIDNFNNIFKKDFIKYKHALQLKYDNKIFTEDEYRYMAFKRFIKLHDYTVETEKQLFKKYLIKPFPNAMEKLVHIESSEKKNVKKQNKVMKPKQNKSESTYHSFVTVGINKENMNYMNDEPVKCPKCRSTQITANKKGFGLGKAAAGGILTGGIGLLGGFIGSGKVKITCLKCGYEWTAGKI